MDADGLRPAAARMGVGVSQIRGIRDGRDPRLSTVEAVCAALDLEIVIRPREPVSDAGPPLPRPRQGSGVMLGPILDRDLGVMLTAVMDHWKALGTAYARRMFVEDAYRSISGLSAQRSARSRDLGMER